MKVAELQEEVAVELALLEATVSEAVALMRDVGLGEATVRERTAAAAFLAQFYGGVENILKRLCRFHGVALPVGETWHVDLLRYFSPPPVDALPDEHLSRLQAGLPGRAS
ncbi:MAG: hypothetical protein SCH98_19230 [Deferrisomatales bacterium]|nr:hypothetical protein [Deferrisomatales bacterium]